MKINKKNNIFIGSLCALGCEMLFGMSYIFTKTATQTATTYALLGWRFLVAAIVMSSCIGVGLIKINLRGKLLKPLLIVAVFSPCTYFIGETIGISQTTASESGVFLACIPVASLIASTVILKKNPSKIQIVGVLITLAGVMLTIFAVGASSSLSFVGYTFLLIAVVSYALYSVFVERADAYKETEITFSMLVVGAIVFGILAVGDAMRAGTMEQLVMLPFRDSTFAIAILYQGIACSVLAFFLSNIAIARMGVNRTSSFIGISTVVSIIAGAFLLQESFSVYQIMGAIVIIIGVYTANAKKSCA